MNPNIAVNTNGGDGWGPFALMSTSAQLQDDNWGDTTTVITGATSDVGYSMNDLRMPVSAKVHTNIGFHCARYIGAFLAGAIGIVAFLSPIAMIILPKVGIRDWRLEDCSPACEGLLVGVAFKLLILAIGSWALFLRRPKATMPRVFAFRAVSVFLTFVLTFAYWLFYGVRILMKPDSMGKSENDGEAVGFKSVVSFATSLVDALLFVHYLAVILIEVRQLQVQYVVKITRSPDGETHSYTVGQFSVQRLAVWCLEEYHKDFQVLEKSIFIKKLNNIYILNSLFIRSSIAAIGRFRLT